MAAAQASSIPQNHVVPSSEKIVPSNSSSSEPTLCLMIDNYDSFTYNLYQYLCQLGANMLVKRHDEITVQEIEKLYNDGELRSIVISPGPGHPRTESGVSRDAITWAMGKVPVLGVCMGLECIVDLLGGEVCNIVGFTQIRMSFPDYVFSALLSRIQRRYRLRLPEKSYTERLH